MDFMTSFLSTVLIFSPTVSLTSFNQSLHFWPYRSCKNYFILFCFGRFSSFAHFKVLVVVHLSSSLLPITDQKYFLVSGYVALWFLLGFFRPRLTTSEVWNESFQKLVDSIVIIEILHITVMKVTLDHTFLKGSFSLGKVLPTFL